MQKRGQVTVAIILVVFIILVLCIVLYINSTIHEKRAESATFKTVSVPLDANAIKNYVDSCIGEVTTKALLIAGKHGGYIDPKGNVTFGESGCSNYTSYNNSLIPYYIIANDAGYVLPIENITEKLRRFTIVELANCLNLSHFSQRGYNISTPNINYSAIGFNFSQAVTNYSATSINISVLQNKDDVDFEFVYPVRIIKRDARTDLVNFKSGVAIPLAAIHQNVTVLVNEIVNNPPYNMSEHCDDYTAVSKVLFLNNTIIRFIANLSEREYVFQFAIKDTPYSGDCD